MTPYWEWIRSEAALIGTDGCSAVMGFHVECCFEHDLGYYYARDPRMAYVVARHRDEHPERYDYSLPDWSCWDMAPAITKGEVDKRFRQCHQNRSKFGRWSPMAIYRWLGVKWGGKGAWEKHRERERQEREALNV